MALALGYAVLLRLFGGFVATVIFLGADAVLSEPRPAYAERDPVRSCPRRESTLLFDQLLNANMPPALFELPL